MPEPVPARRTDQILIGGFVVVLLVHAWLATSNWTAGFMPGHEFRQAQTALITHFIDREDNFGLLYETPLMGKPWVSILLEVPIYEWAVVLLSRAFDLPHVVAARSVSLACFYLTLPALYLLLGRLGLAPPRRLPALALILCCPVYIFYSRAFLMESMVLLGSAWWLFAFVRMMDERRWGWFVLATVAGTAAALIKSATYAIWLLPGAGYGAWMLWRDFRAGRGWVPPALTVFWGLAAVAVPLGALKLWIELTDPLKAQHAAAWIFTSKNLSQGNWGLVDFAARFSPRTWGILLERWGEAIMPPWLLLAALGLGLAALPSARRRLAGLAAVFFLAQLLFPFAYAYQEYYFYACAAFLLAGLGCALPAVLDSRLPRGLAWALVAVLPAAELATYWRVYHGQQNIRSEGGFSFTTALRELTPRDSVIVVGGADWAAMVPLYAQRRALMVRNGLEYDHAYLNRAFGELGDEDVAALVLIGDQRGNPVLRELAVAAFDLDPVPTFSHEIADIYCSRRSSPRVRELLAANGYYGGLRVGTPPAVPLGQPEVFRINAGLARNLLPNVTPAPIRGRFTFGLTRMQLDGREVLDAHPDADLWLRAPAGASSIEWEFGMIPAAWEREGDKTDGVELTITGHGPGGPPRVIFERTLDPHNRPEDRGLQRVSIAYTPVRGELLQFSSRPGPTRSYDWAYWARIDVK